MVRKKEMTRNQMLLISVLGVLLISFVIYVIPKAAETSYVALEGSDTQEKPEKSVVKKKVSHRETPDAVKAIYMTSWIAGTPSLRQTRILDVIDTTEINSVIIDIKDDTGKVSFDTEDLYIKEFGSEEIRIADLRELIEDLHEKDVYVIGRIAVFQDPHMTKVRPDLAAKYTSNQTAVWKDRKGLSWVDPGAKEYWDYVVRLAWASYDAGFDEINFDYVRFPSDGNVSDLYYPFSNQRLMTSSFSMEKAHIIRDFFAYVSEHVTHGKNPVTKDPFKGKISADLFGMTTTASDDMSIGQILEYGLEYFDYVAPMVYPSHFPNGYYGITNVNAVPGMVISISMGEAVKRAEANTTTLAFLGGSPIASTTPQLYVKKTYDKNKLRPWLQDNDYPVHYTAEMVRAQIDATYGVGLNSWMLWDAANTYTRSALLEE